MIPLSALFIALCKVSSIYPQQHKRRFRGSPAVFDEWNDLLTQKNVWKLFITQPEKGLRIGKMERKTCEWFSIFGLGDPCPSKIPTHLTYLRYWFASTHGLLRYQWRQWAVSRCRDMQIRAKGLVTTHVHLMV